MSLIVRFTTLRACSRGISPDRRLHTPGGALLRLLARHSEVAAHDLGLRGHLIPWDDGLSLRDEVITRTSRSFAVRRAIDPRHDPQAHIPPCPGRCPVGTDRAGHVGLACRARPGGTGAERAGP